MEEYILVTELLRIKSKYVSRKRYYLEKEENMGKLFKNVLPYYKSVIAIVLLLIIQAVCDLSLPQYTSNIIDIGIRNSGVEHILPEKITEEEYKYATLFMTDDEKALFESSYEKSNETSGETSAATSNAIYTIKKLSEKELNELDDSLLVPIILTYRMSSMEENAFKQMVAAQLSQNEETAQYASGIDKMTIEEIEKMLGIDVVSFEAEDEEGNVSTYVDIRPIMNAFIQNGSMSDEMIVSARASMEKTMDTMGSSAIKSMGVAYAVACDKKAGIDMDDVQMKYLWSAGFKMIGMTLLLVFAAVATGYIASKVAAGIGKSLRGKVFEKVVGFSNAEIDKFSTASLITRSTNDIQQVQQATVMLLRMALYAPIMGVGGIIKVWNTGANMGWVIGLAVVVIIGFVMILFSLGMPKFKIMQKLVDRVNLVSREILTGISVIRAFGREKTEEERFDEANKELTKTQLFTNRVMTFMMPGMMLIMYCITLLIVWVAANKIDAGEMQVGQMTAFITYSMMIIMAFLMLTAMSIMIPRAGVAAERIDEVLRTDSDISDKENPERIDNIKGVVEFKDVSFKYPKANENVLEKLNFKAEPGKVTAIIGSTGCGKSTLVNLIPRFYDVSEGAITVDGVDIRNISMEDLRGGMGFVPQKGVLFSGTIASNIKFGNRDASDEEMIEAARIAQATEFIETKNEKYNSSIAQGGTNVSGGQKQRLAIARAIAKKPKIFVFDDSFSALDMKTDAILRKELLEKVKNATVIIVAQRVSTIMNADQILVLDDGRIVGKGTHEELIKNCDEYLQIAKSQLSDKELGLESLKEGK